MDWESKVRLAVDCANNGEPEGARVFFEAAASACSSLEERNQACALQVIAIAEQSVGFLACAEGHARCAMAMLPPTNFFHAIHGKTLASILLDQGRAAEALAYLQDAMNVMLDVVPPHHPAVTSCLVFLGKAHIATGDYDQADLVLRTALPRASDEVAVEANNALADLAWVRGEPQRARYHQAQASRAAWSLR